MFKIFIVDLNTWPEHQRAGIAAINDPHTTHPSQMSNKQRQAAITEVAGIRPGDSLLFYVMATQEIYGVYEATTQCFFDPNPLFPGAQHVKNNLPFRVGFKQAMNFNKPLTMKDIWKAKENRDIWSIQQSRGDRVGVRGNWSISQTEFNLVIRMLKEINLSYKTCSGKAPKIENIPSLPIDHRQVRASKCNGDIFNYEDALVSVLIEDLRNGKFRKMLGQFDDIMVKAPTGSRKELDILLLKYDNERDAIIWFEIVEVKKGQFLLEDALQLQGYYEWYSQEMKYGNYRNIHPVALAYCFADETIEYVKTLRKYDRKPPRLIEYRWKNNRLSLSDVTP